ncbi:MAG: single-stranded-DNA-specific exonuclease RecJ, partial [Oscillospiraceae bacterium]
MNVKNWSVLPLNKAEATNIAEKYGVTYIIAMLLQVRGICTAGKINALLGEDDQMESPFVLKDMDKAVARIQRAVEAFEKIAIYGDYDADGITATA